MKLEGPRVPTRNNVHRSGPSGLEAGRWSFLNRRVTCKGIFLQGWEFLPQLELVHSDEAVPGCQSRLPLLADCIRGTRRSRSWALAPVLRDIRRCSHFVEFRVRHVAGRIMAQEQAGRAGPQVCCPRICHK